MTWCRESPGICCKRAHQSQLLEGKEDLGYLFSESESHSVMSDSLQPHGLYSPWTSLGQNIGVGSLSLLLGIFPTQRSNPGLPHCRWILYQLSHKGSPPPQIIYIYRLCVLFSLLNLNLKSYVCMQLCFNQIRQKA